MKGNRLISKIIMVVIFLVGFGFILYPIVANEWNEICLVISRSRLKEVKAQMARYWRNRV